jgi:predicted nucleic acid-binding protein
MTLDRSLCAPHLAAESRDARYAINAINVEQPLGSTNFAAVAADIRAERADTAEREAELLARWTRDVDAADAAIPHCSAEHEAALIAQLGGLLPDDAVVLLAAVYRGLSLSSHIEAHRSAMAGIADAVCTLRAEFERDREPEGEFDGPDPDEAYERSRDDAIDFPGDA